MPNRQALSYPPFASMSRLVVRGPKEAVAREFAGHVAERLTGALARNPEHAARVLGPAPAPIAKLRGMHRFQIQLQGAQPAPIHAALREATDGLESPEGVQWIVDVDPLDML